MGTLSFLICKMGLLITSLRLPHTDVIMLKGTYFISILPEFLQWNDATMRVGYRDVQKTNLK